LFDTGKGKEFTDGILNLEDLKNYALEKGEPDTKRGT